MKFSIILFAAVLAICVWQVSSEAACFTFKTHSDDPFVFKLEDDKKIKHARDLLSGKTTIEPHVLGRIKKTRADYNPKYSYHLVPDTISFFDMAIEVCDSTASYTEEYLDEACGAFLPGCFWCPWSSKIHAEVKC